MDLLKKSVIRECLHPNKSECDIEIKGAHSIQKERILRQLSENDHVFQIELDPKDESFGWKMNKRGIVKQASKFYGFCNFHDNMFSDIENVEDIFASPKQHFLFAYRALAQSYHTSKEMYRLQVKAAKKEPKIVHSLKFQQNVIEKRLLRDQFERSKKLLDDILLDERYSDLETVKLVVNRRSEVAVSSCFTLQCDLEGNLLNKQHSYKKLMLTVCSENNKTYALFSWIKEDSQMFKSFKNQLLSLKESQITSLINNLIPLYCENYFINPRLWQAFSEEEKEELLIVHNTTASARFLLRSNLLRETQYSFFKQGLVLLAKVPPQ